MAAASPEPWYQRLILSPIRQAFSRSHDNESMVPARAEQEAAAFDNGDLGSYQIDERLIHLYDGLHYSHEQREQVARYRPVVSSSVPYREATYAQVLKAAQVMSDNGIKPSQSYRALKAFGAQLDIEAGKLNFTNEL